MNHTKRTFQISDDTFWGYRIVVDMLYIDSLNTVIDLVKNDMKNYFLQRNMLQLVDKVEKLKLHCHSHPNAYLIKNLLETTTEKDIIYLCTCGDDE